MGHCFLSVPSPHLLTLSHTLNSIQSRNPSLTDTHEAAAKLRHHPQIHVHLFTLRKLFVFFFVFFFIWFHQVWLTSMHRSAGSCKRVRNGTDSRQSRAEHRPCRAPESKHNKHFSEPSNEPMQMPAVHKRSHKHTHVRTHTHKENHSPKTKS